jgi:hypothetical protein
MPNLNPIPENQAAAPMMTTASVAEQKNIMETSEDADPQFPRPVRRYTGSSLSSLVKKFRGEKSGPTYR